MPFVDKTGERYGRLLVVEVKGRTKSRNMLWRCNCDCGSETIVASGNLTSGQIKSCGCLRRDIGSRNIKAAHLKVALESHGHAQFGRLTPEYVSWRAMKSRCRDKNLAAYGARGIKVCPQWAVSFEQFLKDMGPRKIDESIDRIDGNGDYTPENCRWASNAEQFSNVRTNKFVEIDGLILHYREAARQFGKCSWGTISSRIHRGWDPVLAITSPA